MADKTKITPSLEDYLETIYFLKEKNGDVRVTDMAEEMKISKPSVNKAVNILKTRDLVSHEHYGLLNLTEKGLEIAKSVARRHEVIKKFLSDILGVEIHRAEEEACLIEHLVSADTVEKLSIHIESVINKN